MSARRFIQEITSAKRGLVRYRVDAAFGDDYRVGHRVSSNFAVTRDGGSFFVVTHLPTGRSLPYFYPRTIQQAKAGAQKMERAADCALKLTAKRYKAESLKLKAVVLNLAGVAQ